MNSICLIYFIVGMMTGAVLGMILHGLLGANGPDEHEDHWR